MTASARPAPALRSRGFDPLRWIWNLLTNVKFALVLVGSAALACLLGVLIPQMPGEMRGNPAARSAWLELQRGDFGAFTGLMDRLGLFEIFHTTWFNGLWFLIIIAVTVCTVSRLRPTIRTVHRPTRIVADSYFDHAHHRAAFSHPGGPDAVEAALRSRHYKVERTAESEGATYLFAERFAWSHYGTFLSHLALLMLLVGGLLTRLAGFGQTLALAETLPAAPVFDSPGAGQIFVGISDAIEGVDGSGNIVDYRSLLTIRKGDETVTCTTTVNDPCKAFGYRFHQAAFFSDVARIRIEDPAGAVVYDSVIDFNEERTAVPHMRVTNLAGGAVVLDEALPQMATDAGTSSSRDDDLAFALVNLTGDEAPVTAAVSWRTDGNDLRVGIATPGEPARNLAPGQPVDLAGYRWEYTGAEAVPAQHILDMPGAVTDDGSVTVQMPKGAGGAEYLFVTGIDPAGSNVVLAEGQPVTNAAGYQYTFLGQLDGAGIDVRRDPGDTFIWIAVAMAVIGLGITFYVPRRRLWVKVTPTFTLMAGIAERTTRFSRELRLIGASLGSRDALHPGDLDPDT